MHDARPVHVQRETAVLIIHIDKENTTMKHSDILHIERVARERGLSAEQVRAALRAYETGGRSARLLLASLGLLPEPPAPEPEMAPEDLQQLSDFLQPAEQDENAPRDFAPVADPIHPEQWR